MRKVSENVGVDQPVTIQSVSNVNLKTGQDEGGRRTVSITR